MQHLNAFSLAIDTGLLVLIWIVQVVVYPSFKKVEAEVFENWHQSYTKRMGYIAAPLMIAQLGLAGAQAVTGFDRVALFYLAAVFATWITTFALSVPLHKKLQKYGNDRIVIAKLVSTNWIRTLLWSGIALRHVLAP